MVAKCEKFNKDKKAKARKADSMAFSTNMAAQAKTVMDHIESRSQETSRYCVYAVLQGAHVSSNYIVDWFEKNYCNDILLPNIPFVYSAAANVGHARPSLVSVHSTMAGYCSSVDISPMTSTSSVSETYVMWDVPDGVLSSMLDHSTEHIGDPSLLCDRQRHM